MMVRLAEIERLNAVTNLQLETISDLEDRLEKAHNTLQRFKQLWTNKPSLKGKLNNATLEAISEAISLVVNLDAVGNPLGGITQFNPLNAASNVRNGIYESQPRPLQSSQSQVRDETKHIRSVKVQGDFAVLVEFVSCRSACAFASALQSIPADTKEEK
jgi:hypothetical protein